MPRRIAALVFLLALAFTQAAAASCPMRAAGPSHPQRTAMGMEHHHHRPSAPSGHQAGPECGLAAACALVADVAVSPVRRPCAAPLARIAAPAGRYASPVLPFDPPPPRPALPA